MNVYVATHPDAHSWHLASDENTTLATDGHIAKPASCQAASSHSNLPFTGFLNKVSAKANTHKHWLMGRSLGFWLEKNDEIIKLKFVYRRVFIHEILVAFHFTFHYEYKCEI